MECIAYRYSTKIYYEWSANISQVSRVVSSAKSPDASLVSVHAIYFHELTLYDSLL